MLIALLLVAPLSSQQIIDAAHRLISDASSIQVSTRYFFEEFHKRETIKRYWTKKGGYFRCEENGLFDVGNPDRGWEYKPSAKYYILEPGIDKTYDPWGNVFCPIPDSKFVPTIGKPLKVKWHGFQTIRVEVNGTKTMTKETKLFLFFNPKSYLPIGVSANLGSITQVTIFQDLKLNSKLDDKLFTFAPPKSWVEVHVSQQTKQ